MAKRTAESESNNAPLKGGTRPDPMDIDDVDDRERGEFEDEFEDEFESEDEIIEAGVDGRPDAEREAEMQEGMGVSLLFTGNCDADLRTAGDTSRTFIVGRDKLEAGQYLSPDLGTYELLHNLSTPWPCLSFDILRDQLGDGNSREKVYPATIYTVTGTQAESKREKENSLIVMKCSGLSRVDKQDDDSDDDSDDDEVADPILESKEYENAVPQSGKET